MYNYVLSCTCRLSVSSIFSCLIGRLHQYVLKTCKISVHRVIYSSTSSNRFIPLLQVSLSQPFKFRIFDIFAVSDNLSKTSSNNLKCLNPVESMCLAYHPSLYSPEKDCFVRQFESTVFAQKARIVLKYVAVVGKV